MKSKNTSHTLKQLSKEENGMESNKYEKYEMGKISRSQIKNAQYNPRKISDKAKKKLKSNIEKVGLIQPIIWNKRTGNIVGGHQRVSIMDSLHKSKDYTLTCAIVDLDEKTEIEQNIFLNNTQAQGEFDLEKLNELIKQDSFELENTGFDIGEIFQIFGSNPVDLSNDQIVTLQDKLDSANKIQKEISASLQDRKDDEFFCVFVFKNKAHRLEVMKKLGFNDEMYQNGQDLTDRL